MVKKSVQDIEVKGRRVLLRVDFNVPLDKGEITDDTRIRASLPTITYLLQGGAKVILFAHLGRPKGKVDEALRLDPVAERLSQLLNRPVHKVDDVLGAEAAEQVARLQNGELLVMENIRFYPEEEANDPQ